MEDNQADVYLIRRALLDAGVQADMKVVNDGETAISYFDSTANGSMERIPDVVLLDLNMPKRGGDEVFRHLKASPRWRQARVVVVTSSTTPADREFFRRAGADEYFAKPSDLDEFLKLGPIVKHLLAGPSA